MPKPAPEPRHIEVLRSLLPRDLSKTEIEAEEARLWTYLRLYHAAARRIVKDEQDSTLRQSKSMLNESK